MHIGTMLDIYHGLCAHVHMGAMTLSLYLHVITFTNECWPDFYNENNIMRVPLSRSAGVAVSREDRNYGMQQELKPSQCLSSLCTCI